MARRLKSEEDLRRYLANLINRVESGDVDSAKAGKLGYLTSILLKIIESSNLEKRLEELKKCTIDEAKTCWCLISIIPDSYILVRSLTILNPNRVGEITTSLKSVVSMLYSLQGRVTCRHPAKAGRRLRFPGRK